VRCSRSGVLGRVAPAGAALAVGPLVLDRLEHLALGGLLDGLLDGVGGGRFGLLDVRLLLDGGVLLEFLLDAVPELHDGKLEQLEVLQHLLGQMHALFHALLEVHFHAHG
jgi:hypothetical protein